MNKCHGPLKAYENLKENLKEHRNVSLHQLALGSSCRSGKKGLQGRSVMFFMLGQSSESPEMDKPQTENVKVTTIDEFCKDRRIEWISFFED